MFKIFFDCFKFSVLFSRAVSNERNGDIVRKNFNEIWSDVMV